MQNTFNQLLSLGGPLVAGLVSLTIIARTLIRNHDGFPAWFTMSIIIFITAIIALTCVYNVFSVW